MVKPQGRSSAYVALVVVMCRAVLISEETRPTQRDTGREWLLYRTELDRAEHALPGVSESSAVTVAGSSRPKPRPN